MSLKDRVLKGSTRDVPAGKSLLESLWTELLKEWTDPDSEPRTTMSAEAQENENVCHAYDAGYCVGLAYAIAKIEEPYVDGEGRIERVIERARQLSNQTRD